MSWEARKIVCLRREFVGLASQDGANLALLCRRFNISRPTGYKWVKRFRQAGDAALEDRSTRPRSSPNKIDPLTEARVVELRKKHPRRGARTIGRMLQNADPQFMLAPSTINGIFRRNGLISPQESIQHQAFQRFEKQHPNELWQMDYKGHFALDRGRCHPLTVIDDHSRYAVGLFACDNERTETVQASLIQIFRRYGIPQAILCDNGSPWGSAGAEEYTRLGVWLMQLGIRILHGRAHHPQTQGKNERFNRTLKAEMLHRRYVDLRECQTNFDCWREEYNWHRPHHALNLEVPGRRYSPSPRAFPETLPQPDYTGTNLEVRCVHNNGTIMIGKKRLKVGLAFAGLKVAIERSTIEDVWTVRFYNQIIKNLDRGSVQ